MRGMWRGGGDERHVEVDEIVYTIHMTYFTCYIFSSLKTNNSNKTI